MRWGCAAVVALAVSSISVRVAEACGCLAPPDPSVPVVQAGERILFSRKDGIITAHIQIQYSGEASEFGWLLPLPSQPTLELGTDELFTQLIRTTQPKYQLQRVFEGACFGGPVANGASPDARALDAGAAGGGVLVEESSIGPYDYAILHADSKDEMLAWLNDNHYFVPVGTEDVVGPYIRRGAYFLALKLRSGRSVGDLQPVVVHYASDLPMIPIILTSVAAQPDMGIQVWMLGQWRAIPRNYAHTVINDAEINWLTAGSNYNDVIIAATKEAPGRHTFVTEYAGSSLLMRNLLDSPGRFGSIAELARLTDPQSFVTYLNQHGYGTRAFGFGPLTYSTNFLAILGTYLPMPEGLPSTPAGFYAAIDYWLGAYRQANPQYFTGWPPASWDAAAAAAELDERIVRPTLAAGALFTQFPYLTRLYTTLSPQHMTRDPVFSENPDLPDYSNVHVGVLTYHCGTKPLSGTTPATLRTADGWVIRYPNGVFQSTVTQLNLPRSRRIEAILEEGPPAVIVNNEADIAKALNQIAAIPGTGGPAAGGDGDSAGCSAGAGRGAPALLAFLALMALGRGVARRR